MYVCICAGVTDDEVNAEIARGADSVEEIGLRCGAGTGCGMCHEKLWAMCSVAGAGCAKLVRAGV